MLTSIGKASCPPDCRILRRLEPLADYMYHPEDLSCQAILPLDFLLQLLTPYKQRMAVVMAEDDARTFYVNYLSIVMAFLCTLAVGLRLVVCLKSKTRLGMDDGFIIASLLVFYSMVACSVLRMYHSACKDSTRC